MNLIDAVILGIVEGITEFLPVSSTGHLIITTWLLEQFGELDASPASVNAFNIIIQGGAILAVLGLFRRRVMQMVRGLFGGSPAGRKLLLNLFIAFLPAAILGPLLDDLIEHFLFRPIPVLLALFLGGLLLLGIGRWQRRRFGDEQASGGGFVDLEDLSWRSALIIGLLQCVAMWPGTSRSMMTIVGGMFMGLRPRQAAEFSFLLGVPTLGGACVYKLGKMLLQDGDGFIQGLGGWTPLIVGVVVAFIAASIAIKWLIEWLNTHGLALFGWWRIGLATVLGVSILQGWISIHPSPTPDEPTVVRKASFQMQETQPPSTCSLASPAGSSASPASMTESRTARSIERS